MKKVLAIVLSLVMVFAVLPVAVFSASAETADFSLSAQFGAVQYCFAIPNADGEILTEDQLKPDLESAIESVEEGGKIVLIKDTEIDGTLNVTKAFTLDLQGHSFISSIQAMLLMKMHLNIQLKT